MSGAPMDRGWASWRRCCNCGKVRRPFVTFRGWLPAVVHFCRRCHGSPKHKSLEAAALKKPGSKPGRAGF